VLRLEAIVFVIDDAGDVVARAPAIPILLHLPGAPLEGSFRYLTGKTIRESQVAEIHGEDLERADPPMPQNGRFAIGEVLRVNCPGSPLHGCRVRNRGLLDIGWRPVAGYYSTDILDGPGAGGTTGVLANQVERV
jgi:hypothetical protein